MLGLRFPALDEVRGAALALRDASRGSALRSQIDVSPGSIRLRRTVPPLDADEAPGSGESAEGSKPVRSWTAKSRRQMTRSYAALDMAPLYEGGRLPVMVTLTYPGDWLVVAPDGEAVQRHFAKFQRRWERAWGELMVMLWKREFQRRGAPHFHIFARQPAGIAGAVRRVRYEAAMTAWLAAGKPGHPPRWRPAAGDGMRITQWVAHVWADVVDHPDPEQRAAMVRSGTQVSFKEALRYVDPKRLSIYFAKHGLYRDKEYQNTPPAEWDGKPVGRFWGATGLKPLVVSVQVDGGQDYQVAKRTLRRWSARTRVWDAQARQYRYVKAVRVRTKGKRKVRRRGEAAEVPRVVRRPVSRLGGYSGTICVNDAPALARDLARVIALRADQDQRDMVVRWPNSLRSEGTSVGVLDTTFACEVCGATHPLREHRVCRARRKTMVRMRT